MPSENKNIEISSQLPVISFKTWKDFEKWLEEHHDDQNGIWLRIYKKNSGVDSIKYEQAVESALCYGWIDGQVKSSDELSYIQKFTPRRNKSIWSKINVERYKKLEKEGRVKPSGKKEAEKAEADGRWERAYGSPNNITFPDNFMQELSKNIKALEFFNTLNKTNKYAISFRLQTAKRPETLERRMKVILEMLEKKQKLY